MVISTNRYVFILRMLFYVQYVTLDTDSGESVWANRACLPVWLLVYSERNCEHFGKGSERPHQSVPNRLRLPLKLGKNFIDFVTCSFKQMLENSPKRRTYFDTFWRFEISRRKLVGVGQLWRVIAVSKSSLASLGFNIRISIYPNNPVFR